MEKITRQMTGTQGRGQDHKAEDNIAWQRTGTQGRQRIGTQGRGLYHNADDRITSVWKRSQDRGQDH